MKIAVTGGAGFIGSAVIRRVLAQTEDTIINIDKLTYAGNLDSLPGAEGHPRYVFEQIDICDRRAMVEIFQKHRPEAIIHLAAESHVDRSIDSPGDFMNTNVVGTFNLLECATDYWWNLPPVEKEGFRFVHVSTDEVYGDLAPRDNPFVESSRYRPSSPYAASKASSDHLARAWNRTFGLPVIVTNCSNNYGPYQFPEKLIPLMILNGTAGKPLPVYGDGCQIRDWLYVDDHASALLLVLQRGRVAETYNIGGRNEYKNLDIVRMICDLLDELVADTRATRATSFSDLITFVTDRPGHDRRYAINSRKIADELGWEPSETLQSGLRKTVEWYLENPTWVQNIRMRGYHGGRLGALNRGDRR